MADDKQPSDALAVKATVKVSRQDIGGFIINALESGSYASFGIRGYVEPPEIKYRWDDRMPCRYADYPINEGGAVILYDRYAKENDEEVKDLRLDLPALQQGLQVLADKHPRIFAQILEGNDDALTADALLQCAVLGEVVYG